MEQDFESLSEDQKREFFNSKLFQKYHSYKSLTDGIQTLQENDVMYDNLVAGIQGRLSRNLAEDTVRDVLQELVNEVEEHTELVESEDEDEESDYL